jgi:WD40 repeat protein
MGFGHAILAIEAHGNRIVDLKIPGCRPTVSVDGQFIAWNSDDHELTTAPLDAEAETPHVGPVKLHILDKKNDIYLIAWSPDGRYVAFGRGPESDGDITKPGTFQWGSAGIGVYAPNWNLFAVPADRACTIDLDKADKADVLQLTHDGNSNKEPFWFRAATRPAAAEAKE